MINYNEGDKDTQGRKDRFFNKRCWGKCIATVKKKTKLQCFPILYININSPWIKYLNVKLNIIKLLEENISRTLVKINCSNFFFLIYLLE